MPSVWNFLSDNYFKRFINLLSTDVIWLRVAQTFCSCFQEHFYKDGLNTKKFFKTFIAVTGLFLKSLIDQSNKTRYLLQ